jgi:hypothetical protein
MNKKQIEATIFELCDFIVDETTKNPLGLSMTTAFWPKEKKWKPTLAEFDDMGDYLTFVLWAGKTLKKKKYVDFAENQMSLWFEYGRREDGWYETIINPFNYQKKNSFAVSLYELQDALLGLYEFYVLTKKKIYLEELDKLADLLEPIIYRFFGRMPNEIIPGVNLAPPWKSANPAVAGIFAEHLYLLADETGMKKYERLGDKLIEGWIKTDLWKNEGLFHQGVNPYFLNFSIYNMTKIMKENSNMVYAMLVRPKRYKKELRRFTDKLLTFQHPLGGFFGYWDVGSSEVVKDRFDKTQNFVAIDLLTALSQALNDKELLGKAEKCADFWLSKKDKKTKLIPEYVRQDGRIRYPIAKLDQSADFYSSLLRLYTATGNKKWLAEAKIGAEAMRKYFGQLGWWHRIVRIEDGKPAREVDVPKKDKPTGMNLTKYVGGALRFYLSLYLVGEGKSMTDDILLHIMSKDR